MSVDIDPKISNQQPSQKSQ
jgi:hypothetical protein